MAAQSDGREKEVTQSSSIQAVEKAVYREFVGSCVLPSVSSVIGDKSGPLADLSRVAGKLATLPGQFSATSAETDIGKMLEKLSKGPEISCGSQIDAIGGAIRGLGGDREQTMAQLSNSSSGRLIGQERKTIRDQIEGIDRWLKEADDNIRALDQMRKNSGLGAKLYLAEAYNEVILATREMKDNILMSRKKLSASLGAADEVLTDSNHQFQNEQQREARAAVILRNAHEKYCQESAALTDDYKQWVKALDKSQKSAEADFMRDKGNAQIASTAIKIYIAAFGGPYAKVGAAVATLMENYLKVKSGQMTAEQGALSSVTDLALMGYGAMSQQETAAKIVVSLYTKWMSKQITDQKPPGAEDYVDLLKQVAKSLGSAARR